MLLIYIHIYNMFQKLPTVLDTSDMDPELARYLNRNYWEQKQDEIKVSTTPSAPSAPVASAVNSEARDSMSGRAEEVKSFSV